MLLINKALVLSNQGRKKDAVEILGNLALDPNSTYATEQMAKSMMEFVTQ
ncbi:MAG: hypothetical protein GXY83_23805 [Rhodopirellula sp.]|nr:hypothetical protein [Rhodopirellula sp.]